MGTTFCNTAVVMCQFWCCAVLQIVVDRSLSSFRAPLLQGGPVSAIFDEQSWRLWQIVAFHLAAATAGCGDVIMRDVTASRINANRCGDEWRPAWIASRKTFKDVYTAPHDRRGCGFIRPREEITVTPSPL